MSNTDRSKTQQTVDGWRSLAALLDQISSRGIKSLTSDEVLAFGRLYRRAAAHLSLAKTQGLDPAALAYLNDLVVRAYGRIYVSESKGLRTIPRFLARELPASFRRNIRYVALAFGIFLVGGILGFALASLKPALADLVLGPAASELLDQYADQFRGTVHIIPEELRPLFSSFIVTRNIWVSVIAFATGIFAGLGTIYVLFSNGLLMGIISGAVQERGVGWNFWGFVLPHGVIELTAIFMAAGAGLMLGLALLSPGDLPRKEALKDAGREAMKLFLGAVSLLGLAALIEAYLSPTAIPNQLKFAFAGAIGSLLLVYFGTGGHTSRHEPPCGPGEAV